MGPALEIRNLTLRFGGATALSALDLSVAPGTVLGLAGPNGSGKSSLLNVLTGHYAAEGSILLDGRPLDALSTPDRIRAGVARTFQTPRAYRRMTVRDNLHAACHALRPVLVSRAARRRVAQDMDARLERFGLAHRAGLMPDALTPAEMRRLELARADATGARLLLLDEPAAGATGDEAHALGRLLADHLLPGRTVILIEHRMDLLRALCDRIAVLRAGRLLTTGPWDSVMAQGDVRACLLGEAADA